MQRWDLWAKVMPAPRSRQASRIVKPSMTMSFFPDVEGAVQRAKLHVVLVGAAVVGEVDVDAQGLAVEQEAAGDGVAGFERGQHAVGGQGGVVNEAIAFLRREVGTAGADGSGLHAVDLGHAGGIEVLPALHPLQARYGEGGADDGLAALGGAKSDGLARFAGIRHENVLIVAAVAHDDGVSRARQFGGMLYGAHGLGLCPRGRVVAIDSHMIGLGSHLARANDHH